MDESKRNLLLALLAFGALSISPVRVWAGDDDDRDDDERRENHACGRGDRAGNAAQAIADERRGIDRDDTRRALADGVVVHQLVLSRPAALFYDLALQDRQHGVAAAEGAHAYLRKGQEQIKIRIQ